MRHPNGYGSVICLGKNRRKPWAVRVTDGWTATGQQKFQYLAYFEKRSDAMIYLADYNKDPSIVRRVPTLSDLYERFISKLESKKSAKTVAMYKTTFRYFEDIKNEQITDIKSIHIQNIVDDLIDDEKSYSTVHKVKVLSSQLYKLAMADDYINKNYAAFISLPKKPKPDKRTFTEEEIEKLYKLAKSDPWANTILIMIYACLRPNEMLGISKFNVKLQDAYMICGGKTDAGTDRIVPMHEKIYPFIKYWMDISKSEYLITKDNSRVTYRYYLEYIYYPTLEKIGAQKLSPQK
ncbi:MAG: tyrosine-type recombinase/integrase, partial [Tissierellia bacterium]|nr:tyrosine-type recombinase/integrase [Tissierellia bacterium]